MDRLDFLAHDELLRFFHNNKTLMSCMERPHTFLSQLRDHNLIPEDGYRSASLMNNREKLKKVVYEILDQFERGRPHDILIFWKCVFNNVIMEQYPTLRKLHNSLMDGSFHFNPLLAEPAEKKRKAPSGDEEQNSGKEKKKQRTRSDEEQPAPSAQLIPASSLKKEEDDDPLASVIFKAQLPVTCGGLQGSLSKDKLAEGQKCILFQKQWFTPNEFERRAGRQNSRNWKLSIRCGGRTLGKLIQDGHLKSVKYKGGCVKADKPRHPSDQTTTDEEESGEETEQQQEADEDSSCLVFQVSCADIRWEAAAEPSWETPEELDQDVKLEEQPVSHFMEISDEESTDEQDQEEKNHRGRSTWNSDEQQPGPSSQLISGSIKTSLPSRLLVTCGDLEGTLFTDRLAKGEKCIFFQKHWFIPSEFERRAGKQSSKNWKLSIRHNGTPLGKLIQDGRLKSVKYKGGCKQVVKVQAQPDSSLPSGPADEPQHPPDLTNTERDELRDHDHSSKVLKVTCGASAATLHKKRFASGACGRSIRTETRWMTPEEFVEASSKSSGSWEKDITWKGNALGVLVENNILRVQCDHHSDKSCEIDQEELDNQKNDDECFVCKTGGDLVLCEHCPRSFHQKCHLPPVENTDLSDDRPWMCTFCEFRSYNNCDKLELQEARAQYVSRHMLNCQYLVLYLCSANKKQTLLPFGNITKKLQSREYQTVGEFISDVQHILNFSEQNQGSAKSLARISRLKELFDGEFRKAFNIR